MLPFATARKLANGSLRLCLELVILDLVLPEVGGIELLSEWRSATRTAGLPVIVLTSKDLSEKEEAYIRSQAIALLRKGQPWKKALVDQLENALAHANPETK